MSPNEDALATEAVDWFLKVDREEPSLETLAAWQQWMEKAPRNREEYEATQRVWDKLDWVKAVEDAPTLALPRGPGEGMRMGMRVRMGMLAAAAALAFVVVWVVPTSQEYRTQIAQHREVVLPDQSRVLVGARSRIKVKFSSAHREVQLQEGEAFFSVAKDPTRPFVVDAGLSKVTAVGTAFNVRRYGNSIAVEVAEGRVRLEKTAGDLRQGQEAVVDQSGAVQTLRTLPAQNVAAWRSGRHSYIDEPLSLVIADLNRYAARPVVLDDPALATLRITTTFFSDDWQGWLATLKTAVPAIALRDSSDAVRISVKSQTND